MKTRFLDFIKRKQLFGQEEPILVAVSGGADSMVLASLLLDCGYEIAVAHCNFQLRAKDSIKDENHVRDWCAANGVPFHLKRVETKDLTRNSSHSTQMVAREERYSFFNQLMDDHGYAVTALAHHADDRIETILINVLRGTGIRGLSGMNAIRDNFARPLLFATKNEILEYADTKSIVFRHDASNDTTDYKRNWVRLNLLPILRMVDPETDVKLNDFGKRVESSLNEYAIWTENQLASLMGGENRIDINILKHHPAPFTILKEALAPFGFSSAQVFEALDLLNSNSGAEIQSKNTRLTRNRDHLLISSADQDRQPPQLVFEELTSTLSDIAHSQKDMILIDSDKVNRDNLIIRNWKTGDRFKPLGMNGWKKLSDYFIDQKFSVPQKQEAWLLADNENIIWIIGHRLDDRFKVTETTKNILRISVKQ